MAKFCVDCGEEKKTDIGERCRRCAALLLMRDPEQRQIRSRPGVAKPRGLVKTAKLCIDCGKEKSCCSGDRCRSCSQRNMKGKRVHYKHSESWRIKASAAQKGRIFSPSHIANLVKAHLGVPLSKEHAAAVKKGQMESPNKPKMAYWKGKKAHPNTKSAARETCIKRNSSGFWKETGIEKKVREFLESLNIEFFHPYGFKGIGSVDFYFPGLSSVIETDGWYFHNKPGVPERDKRKDAGLYSIGIRVLRLPEYEINKDWQNCCQKILNFLKEG